MQKITRIYVGNYGVNAAWYDGITFDLTDPATKAATDALINLENGGGKTTFLSFVFSCFETPMDKFLKHLQNPNHRFGQYFSNDGRPGFIMIEWEMPPKVAGGLGYRLVIGQVVSVRSRADKTDIDRIFFSFEVTDSLRLETVPGPKLEVPEASTLAEVTKWIHESQRDNNDFYSTRGQSDWQKHLRDERMIDVEMLQLQVFFSAQEGGIDTSFLTFKSEPEFVQKFFDLTIDSTRAEAVRETVVRTCDKLSRKPQTELRLRELQQLEHSIQAFNQHAQQYLAAQGARSTAEQAGAGLVVSLQQRAKSLRERISSESRDAQVHSEAISLKRDELKVTSEFVDAVVYVQSAHALDRAIAAREGAEEKLRECRSRGRYLEAARVKTEVANALAVRTVFEQQAAAAANSLMPWKERVEQNGAALRDALNAAIEQTSSALDEAETAQLVAKRRQAELKLQQRQGAEEDASLRSELARFEEQESSCSAAHQLLVDQEALSASESTKDALERLDIEFVELNNESARCKLSIDELISESDRFHREAKREREKIAGLTVGKEHAQKLVAAGEAERERLSQLPVACLAAEADLADPDSPALANALSRLAQSSAAEVALLSVRLSQLNASRSSIDDTGVAGQSADVNAVVARLRELGVKSAHPFSSYIAQQIDDADKARALVLSNPARFSGVCVASSEMQRAHKIVSETLMLHAPVVISVATLEPETAGGAHLVLPASDDAAFNFSAASRLLSSLETRLTEEEKRRDFYATQHADAMLAVHSLDQYVEKFGNGKIQGQLDEIARLDAEIEVVMARIEMLERESANALASCDDYRAKANSIATRAVTCSTQMRDIQNFVRMHEAEQATRMQRIGDIKDRREILSAGQLEIEVEQEQIESALSRHAGEIQHLQATRQKLSEKIGTIKYFDSAPASASVVGAYGAGDIDLLTELYTTAASQYEAEEKDKIGLLQVHLDNARAAYSSKANEFEAQYGEIADALIAPFLIGTYEAWRKTLTDEEAIATAAKDSAMQVYGAAVEAVKRGKHPNELSVRAVEDAKQLSEDQLAEALIEFKKQVEVIAAAISNIDQHMRLLHTSIDKCSADASQCEFLASNLLTSLSLTAVVDAVPVEIDDDAQLQVSGIIQRFTERSRSVDSAYRTASASFERVKDMARTSAMNQAEPEIATQLQKSLFDEACTDGSRVAAHVSDRISATTSILSGMQSDFEACIGELLNLTNNAISVLMAATTKRVPQTAPWVAGMPMLKMQAKFNEVQLEARRVALRNYLDSLIDTRVVPAKGAAMVADSVLRIYARSLGIKLLKMSPDTDLQYVSVDKIQNSGGEAVVMAMFLYLLINQIRSETQAKLKRHGGGPLILDNPFAKATNPAMWKAQRLLASAMDVQLIFATALPDYNAVADFPRFIHLRKAGKNTRSSRWHLEIADVSLHGRESDSE